MTSAKRPNPARNRRRRGSRSRSTGPDRAVAPSSEIERAGDADSRAIQYMGVDHGRRHVSVTEQLLNGTDVVVRLQQMGGETVPEGVAADPLDDPAAPRSLLHGTLQSALVQVMTTDRPRALIDRQTVLAVTLFRGFIPTSSELSDCRRPAFCRRLTRSADRYERRGHRPTPTCPGDSESRQQPHRSSASRSPTCRASCYADERRDIGVDRGRSSMGLVPVRRAEEFGKTARNKVRYNRRPDGNRNCQRSSRAAVGYFLASASGRRTSPYPAARSCSCKSPTEPMRVFNPSTSCFGRGTYRSFFPFAWQT